MADKTPDLVVGQTYTNTEVGGLAGGVAVVPGDRIVTDELAWSRMTVGRLMEWLTLAREADEIDDDTQIFVDSDPEGNDSHPLRAAAALLGTRVVVQRGYPTVTIDEDATEFALPARAVWIGVGY